MLLHGCNQTAQELIEGSRMRQAARQRGYFLLAPEQLARHNPERCWNWFLPQNQRRDSGEAGILADLVQKTLRDHPLTGPAAIDPNRVFVAGLSAGAAMANILASCYPELFKAVASHSGMAYASAFDPWTALWSVAHGSPHSPEAMGGAAYRCGGPHSRPIPALVIQGSEDTRVLPVNATQTLQAYATLGDWADDGRANQSQNLDDPVRETSQVAGGYTYVLERYPHARLKAVWVKGMAHAWSGGDPTFARTDPRGPDATKLLLDHFDEQE